MNTTYHDLFDTQYKEERLWARLKYGCSDSIGYEEILYYLNEEIEEIQNAFWALIYELRREDGWEDEEFDEYYAHTNYTLVENFAEKFGWNRLELLYRYFEG